MSICIACQAQLEGGGGPVCLPAYLSKDRTWLTLSGGVNSLLVINLALPVEAACHEHLPGPSLTPINMFTANAIWWSDSDKLPRMLCLIMPQNCRVYSHVGGLLLCKQGENIGLMCRRADDEEKPDRRPGQTSPLSSPGGSRAGFVSSPRPTSRRRSKFFRLCWSSPEGLPRAAPVRLGGGSAVNCGAPSRPRSVLLCLPLHVSSKTQPPRPQLKAAFLLMSLGSLKNSEVFASQKKKEKTALGKHINMRGQESTAVLKRHTWIQMFLILLTVWE